MKEFTFIGMDGTVDQNLNLAIKLGKKVTKNNKPLKYKELMKQGDIIGVPNELARVQAYTRKSKAQKKSKKIKKLRKTKKERNKKCLHQVTHSIMQG